MYTNVCVSQCGRMGVRLHEFATNNQQINCARTFSVYEHGHNYSTTFYFCNAIQHNRSTLSGGGDVLVVYVYLFLFYNRLRAAKNRKRKNQNKFLRNSIPLPNRTNSRVWAFVFNSWLFELSAEIIKLLEVNSTTCKPHLFGEFSCDL